MEKFKILIASLSLLVSAFFGVDYGFAQTQETITPTRTLSGHRKITNADREAAAARFLGTPQSLQNKFFIGAPVPGGTPNYFGPEPNWAYSPIPVIDPKTHKPIVGTGIRKFVDTLPGLGFANRNNIGNYIPVAIPDTAAFSNSDYYELSVVEYTQRLHSDLPATTQLRGYKQTNTTDATVNVPFYLGPLIIAKKDTPVRIKFTNQLPTGTAGNLFLPVDTTTMGAGMGSKFDNSDPCDPATQDCAMYTQNRATLHLHGGNTPWISDGTPHQWTVPDGEATPYKKGVSTQNVPDMDPPGDGSMTFYWPNQQSGRLMFFHDHAYGITRLNVYAGEAAGYLLWDQVEEDLISGTNVSGANPTNAKVIPDLGGVYHFGIPLIIQDKTFVPDSAHITAQDPTWNWGGLGNLWFPHVYMPNQNPSDSSGANMFGRWDYGPWFWPPMDPSKLKGQPVQIGVDGQGNPVFAPGTPNPSMVPEAFLDTPLVNGAAYPSLTVERKAYRFRILNACNDRTLNLQLYYAATAKGSVCKGFTKNGCTEVKMVPAVAGKKMPATWPTDGRAGGVPDPKTVGPSMIQIGTEGGLLPAPVVLPNTPVGYNYNRRDIVVLNVENKTLMLGPAERADVIIDFSKVPNGARLILYSDAPAPVPAFDTRNDYYTGDPDQTSTGGAPTTLAGYGPNTRTIMQFKVSSRKAAAPFNLAALQAAFASTDTNLGAFAAAQPQIIVPESTYNSAYNKTFNNTFSRIESTSLTYFDNSNILNESAITRKAIQELFEPSYGRMNAILGVELPLTNFLTQTTIPYFYIDPPTEIINDGETQIWKITHNGVDTHAIHFHLFNVQLINRVGWDGAIRPPDPNELGWKETVRMNPLEDAIVALKPLKQDLPWSVPNSTRLLDVTMPEHSSGQFTGIDINNNPVNVTNESTDFGWEYVWHCHLLGHEENDMMRPIVFQVPLAAPDAPSGLGAAVVGSHVDLTWTDNSSNENGFIIGRATAALGPYTQIGATLANAVTFSDTTVSSGTTYYYEVTATNAAGDSAPSDPSSPVTP